MQTELTIRKIQRWYHMQYLYKSLKSKFLASFTREKFDVIRFSLIPYSSAQTTPSFEICQSTLFNPEFFESFSNIVSEIFYRSMEYSAMVHFNDFHNQHPHEGNPPTFRENSVASSSSSASIQKNTHKTFIKTLLSAYLIANFPSDILESSQSSNPVSPKGNEKSVNYSELKQKSQICLSGSKLCIKYVSKLLDFIDKFWFSDDTNSKPFTEMLLFKKLLQKSLFAFRFYLTSFHEWKRLDSLLIIQSLEETFQQSYLAYLFAKKEAESTNDAQSSSLVKSSEIQFMKIQDMLKRIVGAKSATARVEEIKASVEASNSHLFQAEDATLTSDFGEKSAVLQQDLSSLNENIKTEVLQIPSTDLNQRNEGQGKATALKQLEMLSRLAGIENERLAYEITLDKHYRLPVKHQRLLKEFTTDPLNAIHSGNDQPKSLADVLKDRFLLTMADKLVNSLRKSPVSSYDEITVGMVLPILVGQRFLSPDGREIESLFWFSGKILSIRENHETEKVEDRILEVEYVADQMIEQNVLIRRVKLSSSENNSFVLIHALYDVIQQIFQLIPSRKDLIQSLQNCFDPDLLTQMIQKDAINPKSDLLPIFRYIYEFLTGLQAEYRLDYSNKWLKEFEAVFEMPEDTDTTAKSAYLANNKICNAGKERFINLIPSPKEQGNNKIRLDDILPVLPLFFERVTECVEEIQRDMANYYISLLVPVFQQSGYEFLLNRFQHRITEGTTTLQNITSILHAQIHPDSSFKQFVQDCIEADICGPHGFHMSDLINSSILTSNPLQQELLKAIVAKSFISILQLPYRLDSPLILQMNVLPETFSFDQIRLAKIRDLIDKITLENSLLIVLKQFLSLNYKIILHENEEMEFIYRTDVILSQVDFTVSHVNQEIVRFIASVIMIRKQTLQHPYPANHSTIASTLTTSSIVNPTSITSNMKNEIPVSSAAAMFQSLDGEVNLKELEEKVSKMVKDIIQEGNPVMQLFQKRIYKLLLRILLNKPFQAKLKQYSLHSKGNDKHLHQLFISTNHLFQHNYKIFHQIYAKIVTVSVESILKTTEQTVSQEENIVHSEK